MDINAISDVIFKFYKSQLEDRKVIVEKVEEYEYDKEKYHSCLNDIVSRLKVKLNNDGCCSTILIQQLVRHKCNLGEQFYDKEINQNIVEYYNSSSILDLIESIELKTIKGSKFDKLPLKELTKLHHSAYSSLGYSIIKNISKFWFDNEGIVKNKKKKSFERIVNSSSGEISTILNEMHSKAIYSRKLTGEWLIYTSKNNHNYYLCLATHGEGDENIFDNKIKPCYLEFPELITSY